MDWRAIIEKQITLLEETNDRLAIEGKEAYEFRANAELIGKLVTLIR